MTSWAAGLRAAAGSTALLVRLRWHMAGRGMTLKLVAGGVVFYGFALLVTTNLGYLAGIAAQQPDTAQGVFARAWANSLQYGYQFNLGAFAVGGALAVALLAPFLGTATLSLAASDDLAALRPHRGHRYFDALLLNAVSPLGLLQLLVLSGAASLLTMDGSRGAGLLVAWACWLLLIALMTTVGWVVSAANRRFGSKRVLAVAGGVLLVVAAAVALWPRSAVRLFGLSDLFTAAIRSGVHDFSGLTALAVVAPLVMGVALVLVGVPVAVRAQQLPEVPPRAPRSLRARWIPTRPWWALLVTQVRVLVRTPEIRRPLVGLLVAGVVIAMFVPLAGTALFGVLAAGGLAVSLAWAVNPLGLLGSSLSWLAGQPRAFALLPYTSLALQMAMTGLVYGAIWSVAALAGTLPSSSFPAFWVGAAIVSVGCAATSGALSILRPHRTRLSGRGDSIVPPLTAIAWLMLLLLSGPVPAVLLLDSSVPANPAVPTVLLVGAVGGWVVAVSRWARRSTQAAVLARVSAE